MSVVRKVIVVAVLDFSSSKDCMRLRLLDYCEKYGCGLSLRSVGVYSLLAETWIGLGLACDKKGNYDCGRFLSARKTREKCLHITIKLFIAFKSHPMIKNLIPNTQQITQNSTRSIKSSDLYSSWYYSFNFLIEKSFSILS